jgi:DNA (cytosine-5)-methyltransferase 1
MINETFHVCYDRLWALLHTRKMKKKDLMSITHLSSSVIAKLGKGLPVHMNTLLKICEVLHCTLDEIVDISSVFRSMPDRSVTQ